MNDAPTLTDMDDLFNDTAPTLTPDERHAAAFAVEDGDFGLVHRIIDDDNSLLDTYRLESEAAYGETLS